MSETTQKENMAANQLSAFHTEMEIVKELVKMTREERIKEVRKQMFTELRALEMERRERVALENAERLKREEEERAKIAESAMILKEKQEKRMRKERERQDRIKCAERKNEGMVRWDIYMPGPQESVGPPTIMYNNWVAEESTKSNQITTPTSNRSVQESLNPKLWHKMYQALRKRTKPCILRLDEKYIRGTLPGAVLSEPEATS
ncbi:Hypothetical predicted protein [Scomber scombrus]|uniref:Uncharacterized protein n=1 Tax=Scomber scombrus TaxID=13677 RepID=A0AAV1NH13_SCOSC